MSTTKQMSLAEMINRLSSAIEDDELFCKEELEMVHNYCEQKNFRCQRRLIGNPQSWSYGQL